MCQIRSDRFKDLTFHFYQHLFCDIKKALQPAKLCNREHMCLSLRNHSDPDHKSTQWKQIRNILFVELSNKACTSSRGNRSRWPGTTSDSIQLFLWKQEQFIVAHYYILCHESLCASVISPPYC